MCYHPRVHDARLLGLGAASGAVDKGFENTRPEHNACFGAVQYQRRIVQARMVDVRGVFAKETRFVDAAVEVECVHPATRSCQVEALWEAVQLVPRGVNDARWCGCVRRREMLENVLIRDVLM